MIRIILTTCKGRLESLRASVPTWQAHLPDWRIVVADWGDPDCSAEWATTLGHVGIDCAGLLGRDCARWHKSRCWNTALPWAVRELGAEWIALLDADHMLSGPAGQVARAFDDLCELGPGHWGREVGINKPGAIICHARDFEAAGGADESFVGWGCEDWNLRCRLCLRAGARPVSLPVAFRQAHHTDDSRNRFDAHPGRRARRVESTSRWNTRLAWKRLYELEAETGRRASRTPTEGLIFNPASTANSENRITSERDRALRTVFRTGEIMVHQAYRGQP